MTGKFSHRISSLLLAGLCMAVVLTSLIVVDGQRYYNPYAYNDPQAALDRNDEARAYQNLNSEYYNPYTYNDPQAALDLADIAGSNQKLYDYDSSDWNYWANLWLNAPY
jgi:hypothetical protein